MFLRNTTHGDNASLPPLPRHGSYIKIFMKSFTSDKTLNMFVSVVYTHSTSVFFIPSHSPAIQLHFRLMIPEDNILC